MQCVSFAHGPAQLIAACIHTTLIGALNPRAASSIGYPTGCLTCLAALAGLMWACMQTPVQVLNCCCCPANKDHQLPCQLLKAVPAGQQAGCGGWNLSVLPGAPQELASNSRRLMHSLSTVLCNARVLSLCCRGLEFRWLQEALHIDLVPPAHACVHVCAATMPCQAIAPC